MQIILDPTATIANRNILMNIDPESAIIPKFIP